MGSSGINGREENADKFLIHYGIDMKSLPQVLVLNFTDRKNEMHFNVRDMLLDAVPTLLRGVVNGTIKPRTESFWDFPDMFWIHAKSIFPFLPLEKLGFLPQYTFTAGIGLL